MNKLIIILISTAFIGCKSKTADSDLQTLDNFSAGKNLRINDCGIKKPVDRPSVKDLVRRIRLKGVKAEGSSKLITAVASGINTLPQPVIDLFKVYGGTILITPNVVSACSAPFPEEDRQKVRGLGDFDACWKYGKNEDLKLNRQVEIVLKNDLQTIRHQIVRQFGYFYAQLASFTDYKNPGQLLNVESKDIAMVKTALGIAYLNDIEKKKVFDLQSIMARYAPASSQAELLGAIGNGVFAESFDSFYCNRDASYDKALLKDIGANKTAASKLNKIQNTVAVMQELFPRTYKVFQSYACQKLDRGTDPLCKTKINAGNSFNLADAEGGGSDAGGKSSGGTSSGSNSSSSNSGGTSGGGGSSGSWDEPTNNEPANNTKKADRPSSRGPYGPATPPQFAGGGVDPIVDGNPNQFIGANQIPPKYSENLTSDQKSARQNFYAYDQYAEDHRDLTGSYPSNYANDMQQLAQAGGPGFDQEVAQFQKNKFETNNQQRQESMQRFEEKTQLAALEKKLAIEQKDQQTLDQKETIINYATYPVRATGDYLQSQLDDWYEAHNYYATKPTDSYAGKILQKGLQATDPLAQTGYVVTSSGLNAGSTYVQGMMAGPVETADLILHPDRKLREVKNTYQDAMNTDGNNIFTAGARAGVPGFNKVYTGVESGDVGETAGGVSDLIGFGTGAVEKTKKVKDYVFMGGVDNAVPKAKK